MAVLVFLIEALTRLRQWFTVRRVLHLCALLIILALAGQLLAITDMGFLLAFDWGLALEVFGAIMIVSARTQLTTTARYLRHKLLITGRRIGALMRRARTTRGRPQAKPKLPSSLDEDGGWHRGYGWAF